MALAIRELTDAVCEWTGAQPNRDNSESGDGLCADSLWLQLPLIVYRIGSKLEAFVDAWQGQTTSPSITFNQL